MPQITASDGVGLHYEVHGNGPTDLILLHGMGGSTASWELLLREFDPCRFRVLTLDLRGHGKSQGDATNFTFPQLTADILAVAAHAGFGSAVLVTHSGSSKNAVCVAVAAPQLVNGLILVAPAGMGVVPLPRETLKWFFDAIGRDGKIPAEFDPWFTAKIGRHRELVDREYFHTARAVLDASVELWVHTSIAEQAARTTQPVLVIAGVQEPVYHPEFQRQTTLASLPRARMEIFDCGHFIALEEPKALAAAITRFCAGLS